MRKNKTFSLSHQFPQSKARWGGRRCVCWKVGQNELLITGANIRSRKWVTKRPQVRKLGLFPGFFKEQNVGHRRERERQDTFFNRFYHNAPAWTRGVFLEFACPVSIFQLFFPFNIQEAVWLFDLLSNLYLLLIFFFSSLSSNHATSRCIKGQRESVWGRYDTFFSTSTWKSSLSPFSNLGQWWRRNCSRDKEEKGGGDCLRNIAGLAHFLPIYKKRKKTVENILKSSKFFFAFHQAFIFLCTWECGRNKAILYPPAPAPPQPAPSSNGLMSPRRPIRSLVVTYCFPIPLLEEIL